MHIHRLRRYFLVKDRLVMEDSPGFFKVRFPDSVRFFAGKSPVFRTQSTNRSTIFLSVFKELKNTLQTLNQSPGDHGVLMLKS